ncbi:N-acetylmuramoyl-L-alanine amidase CwlD [Marinicrinis sediminis]|uniref:N-acetylmuramoyl-L-alanine amidase CwlD n=1 Tax=Marinicrinis sediminis TaxID=1652465 RepID=A0ABW5RBK4_9BACL
MFRRRKKRVIWIRYRSKKRVLWTGIMLALLIVIMSYQFPSMDTWNHWSLPLSGKVIVIDPGHGGPDGGATSQDGVKEAEVNLEISLRLRDYLQQAGALVILTRETDTDLADENPPGTRKRQDLMRRVEIITKHQADFFISVHLNSIASSRWSGAQTFYASKNSEGKRLALAIQDELKHQLSNTTREAHSADTKYILHSHPIPGVIVEAGFLSNPEEARRLSETAYQNRIAAAIYQGTLRYASGDIPTPSY